MQITHIAALVASTAVVSAKPFFGLFKRADMPSLTTVQGFVGYPTTLSNTYPDGYISASTYWIGSYCVGQVCTTTITQLFASSTCTECAHYITSGVTTDLNGDNLTYTGDVYVTTDSTGGLVTNYDITGLPQSFTPGHGAFVTITEDVAVSCDDFSLCTTTTFPLS